MSISFFEFKRFTLFRHIVVWGSLILLTTNVLAKSDLGDDSVWLKQSKQAVSDVDGFVVFSSNRDGNHDIFKLDLTSYELSKVTRHPHTETYPRISSDGKRVVFARAHQPWVSQRNTLLWDVYVVDLQSKEETLVGRGGTAPFWIGDDEITYLKDATTVMKVNVVTLQSEILYQTGVNNSMPVGAHIQNPKYNPQTKQIVFTGRQNQIGMHTGFWGTALSDGETHQGVHNGCELSWNSAGNELFQVAGGGRSDTLRIASVDPESLHLSTLIDLEGEFSHEYWPKESQNGKYMVFGASRSKKEHTHDEADYEIFLWKSGSKPQEAIRLTFNTANENWPDVFIR